jgi:hypothetical protein
MARSVVGWASLVGGRVGSGFTFLANHVRRFLCALCESFAYSAVKSFFGLGVASAWRVSTIPQTTDD